MIIFGIIMNEKIVYDTLRKIVNNNNISVQPNLITLYRLFNDDFRDECFDYFDFYMSNNAEDIHISLKEIQSALDKLIKSNLIYRYVKFGEVHYGVYKVVNHKNDLFNSATTDERQCMQNVVAIFERYAFEYRILRDVNLFAVSLDESKQPIASFYKENDVLRFKFSASVNGKQAFREYCVDRFNYEKICNYIEQFYTMYPLPGIIEKKYYSMDRYNFDLLKYMNFQVNNSITAKKLLLKIIQTNHFPNIIVLCKLKKFQNSVYYTKLSEKINFKIITADQMDVITSQFTSSNVIDNSQSICLLDVKLLESFQNEINQKMWYFDDSDLEIEVGEKIFSSILIIDASVDFYRHLESKYAYDDIKKLFDKIIHIDINSSAKNLKYFCDTLTYFNVCKNLSEYYYCFKSYGDEEDGDSYEYKYRIEGHSELLKKINEHVTFVSSSLLLSFDKKYLLPKLKRKSNSKDSHILTITNNKSEYDIYIDDMRQHMISTNRFLDVAKMEKFIKENQNYILKCYKNGFSVQQTWDFILKE